MSEAGGRSILTFNKPKPGTALARMSSGPSKAVEQFKKPGKGPSLDDDEHRRLHARLLGYYEQEIERQRKNRFEIAKDIACYDGDQWEETDKIVVENRGQVPLVFNITATTINWVIGSQLRSRKDFKVLPRREDAATAAQRKSEILKYLDDVNKSGFAESDAFAETVKGGISWMECGVQTGDDGEPIYDRFESWKHVLWDSAAQARDLSDGRYMIRAKFIDLDVAQAIFPKRKEQLARSSAVAGTMGQERDWGDDAMDAQERMLDTPFGTSKNTGSARERVRLIEVWYREPVTVMRHTHGPYAGEVYDEQFPEHVEAVEAGRARIHERPMMRMHCAVMTTEDLLWAGPSPYRHNKFPFTPLFCYRRGDTGLPYGMIRNLRDINFDLNKRASKALAILSSNKTVMEEGAVDDIDEYIEEASRPDAVIVKKPGKALDMNVDRNLADGHVLLMQHDMAMIQSVAGVTDENLGKRTNATSGIAIGRRQEQGALATAAVFDNLSYARQIHGEKKLSLIEQFMWEEKQFRITNQRGTPTYITVNDGLPENDIVRSRADFIISEDEWRASLRQAQVEMLMQLMGELAKVHPQAPLAMLDLVIEAMDIPQREELVKRVRQITGQRDPDAVEMTPEEQAAMAEKQKQAALQQAMIEADLADKQASAAQKMSVAQRNAAAIEGENAKKAGINIKTIQDALTAASEALAAMQLLPGLNETADQLLQDSGFKPSREPTVGEGLAAAAAAAPPAPAQPPAQPVPADQAAPMGPPEGAIPPDQGVQP